MIEQRLMPIEGSFELDLKGVKIFSKALINLLTKTEVEVFLICDGLLAIKEFST
jgi:hypothetical protein